MTQSSKMTALFLVAAAIGVATMCVVIATTKHIPMTRMAEQRTIYIDGQVPQSGTSTSLSGYASMDELMAVSSRLDNVESWLALGFTSTNPLQRIDGTNRWVVYDENHLPPSQQSLSFDPLYFSQSGGNVSLNQWHMSVMMAGWFRDTILADISTGAFAGGPAHVFNDQASVLASRSSGYLWCNPYYGNTSLAGNGPAGQAVINVAANGVPISSNPVSGGVSFTMAIWVRVDSLNGNNGIPLFLGEVGERAAAYFGIHDSGGNGWLKAYVWTGSGPIELVDANTDRDWHHLAMTYDSAIPRWTAYCDGIDYGHFDESISLSAAAGRDGICGLGNNFDGAADELGIWSRCLSSNEVLALATTSTYISGDLTNGIELLLHLDEGSGTAVSDSSGFGRDTTLAGSWTTGIAAEASESEAEDLVVVTTNMTLPVAGRVAAIHAAVETVANGWTTNELRLGAIDIDVDATYWATNLLWVSSLASNQQVYRGDLIVPRNANPINNASLIANLSSNVSAKLMGLSGVFAP